MALAARRRRRRKPWLLFAVLLTLVVLLVNAAVSARSKGPSRRLAELAYLDEVRPLVERSTEQGAELRQVRTDAAKLGRALANRRLDKVHQDAESALRGVRGTAPPATLRTQHSLLVATLALRAHATMTVQSALVQALGTDPPEAAVTALVGAGQDMAAGDRAYQVFLDGLPKAEGVQAEVMPPSRWVEDIHGWEQPELTVFVGSLRSSTALAPVHDVAVILFTTDPASVGTDGGASVLPVVKTLRLQIVVANAGNETEKRVPVVATVTPPPGVGAPDTARDFVDLAPGQRMAVTLGGLRVAGGGARSTLTVTIGPAEGETTTADNTKTLEFVVR
ncbi:MAG TPA: hypothetical protein VGO92_11070 [Acidimicrobiales bacterium]|jgi:hypothetical protein|nr:hypothetical protein [Acidimicrobiales bacterium]